MGNKLGKMGADMIVRIEKNDLISILSMQSRDIVKNLFKNIKQGKKCNNQDCIEKDKLQVAHKKGSERSDIVKKIVEDILIELGRKDNKCFSSKEYFIRFKKYHKENKIVCFLCSKCHKEYHNGELSENKLKDPWISANNN